MSKTILLCFSILIINHLAAQPELENAATVERNVIYGMYSGLALVMDVYYPEQPNGYAVLTNLGQRLDKTPWIRGPDPQPPRPCQV